VAKHIGVTVNFKQLFTESYERAVLGNQEPFFAEFYAIFISKSLDLKHMFAQTNMRKQRQSLATSLTLLVWFAEEHKSDAQLEQLAKQHAGFGLTAELYDVWMDALIEALKKTDTQHTKEESLAWRIILSPGITFMKQFNL